MKNSSNVSKLSVTKIIISKFSDSQVICYTQFPPTQGTHV
jgi:hypothetical protein